MKSLPPEIAWPGFVIVLLLLGVGSTFGVLYFSGVDGGPAVEQSYYSKGVAWDSVAAVRGATARFGWRIDMRFGQTADGARSLNLTVSDSLGNPLSSLSGSVELYRPDRSDAIYQRSLDGFADGRVELEFNTLSAGLWDIVVAGTHDGQSFEHRVRRELY